MNLILTFELFFMFSLLSQGPPPMINAMKGHLEELKYEKPRTVSKLPDVSDLSLHISLLRPCSLEHCIGCLEARSNRLSCLEFLLTFFPLVLKSSVSLIIQRTTASLLFLGCHKPKKQSISKACSFRFHFLPFFQSQLVSFKNRAMIFLLLSLSTFSARDSF